MAILNIIEGKYDQAVKLLLPIYMSNKNDALVQANLMLAMAKAGDLEFMEKYCRRNSVNKKLKGATQFLKILNHIVMIQTCLERINIMKIKKE